MNGEVYFAGPAGRPLQPDKSATGFVFAIRTRFLIGKVYRHFHSELVLLSPETNFNFNLDLNLN